MPGREFSIGILLAGFLMCISGCGPSYGTPTTIKGKVTVGGAPAKDVNLIFQATGKLPADKRFAQTKVKDDGTFELSGVYPADYQVSLQSAVAADPTMNSATPESNVPVNEDGTAITKSATVPTGNNEFTFDF